ncbi:MAG: M15 family metallopeptidase [Lachnospiraceae bacterium]|nr:M15 family metallopeptidase [Lachnospiraceae bacterium]
MSSTGKAADSSIATENGGSVTSNEADAYTGTKSRIPDTSAETSAGNDQDTAQPVEESDTMEHSPDRITYEDGFYYEPLTESVKERITGISYPESGCTVPYEDLNYVGLKYIDFNGQEQTGELICNKAIAQDMTEIFYELYRNEYRLESVRLIDEYGGDDTASMAENNTSCFNYRVVDGTTSLSKHAYGLAIDVNPYYNPYVVFNRNADGSDYISPPGSEIYADRSQNFAYKIDENDLCYRLFTERGFTWGGNWNSSKDYQHFQKVIN